VVNYGAVRMLRMGANQPTSCKALLSPGKRADRTTALTVPADRYARRMVARGVSIRWEKSETKARTGSGRVRGFRLSLGNAPTRRACAARPAVSGSATPMLRMSSGIHACCQRPQRKSETELLPVQDPPACTRSMSAPTLRSFSTIPSYPRSM